MEYSDAVAEVRELFDPGGKHAAREAELDRQHPERVQKREWRRAAHAEGKVCGECGQPLSDGRAYLFNQSRQSFFGRSVGEPYPVCPPCAERRHGGTRLDGSTWESDYAEYQWNGVGHWLGYWTDHPCGGCERPLRVGIYRRDGRFYCSDVCRQRGRLQRERELRAARRETHHPTCEVCGQTFPAARTDARYCSNACRQRAYRQRVSQ
jgi:hypothetical protein